MRGRAVAMLKCSTTSVYYRHGMVLSMPSMSDPWPRLLRRALEARRRLARCLMSRRGGRLRPARQPHRCVCSAVLELSTLCLPRRNSCSSSACSLLLLYLFSPCLFYECEMRVGMFAQQRVHALRYHPATFNQRRQEASVKVLQRHSQPVPSPNL